MSDTNIAVCKAFGSAIGCRFGNRCRFRHNNPNSIPLCKYYTSSRGCYAGNTCHWRHDNFADNNNKHLNVDEDITIPICIYFNTNGCNKSVSCKYRHISDTQSVNVRQLTNEQIKATVFGYIR
eukprot:749042_1